MGGGESFWSGCGRGGGLVTQSCPSPETLWTAACQTPLSMGFPRQEYWSGLPFASPGDLLDPRIEPESPALAGRFFTTEPPGKPQAPLERRIKTRIHSFVKLEMVN